MKRTLLPIIASASLLVAGASSGGPATADRADGDEPTASEPVDEQRLGVYRVSGLHDDSSDELTDAGAYVEELSGDTVIVSATRDAAERIEQLGYGVEELSAPDTVRTMAVEPAADEFPSGYEGYHTYDEMVAEMEAAAADHPELVEMFSVGQSYEGRELWAARITSEVLPALEKPEAVMTHGLHAREHLTIEQGLYTMNLLTDEYGSDQQITELVDARQIVLIMNVNPDGSEYDYADGGFAHWRKNRQPNPGSSYVGTDLNRNWGYMWGCCSGSSPNPRSDTYRGSEPFSAPETSAVRDYIASRVVDGEQQITVLIDVHTYGELVLWPYGYTYEDVPDDMTQEDHDTLVALGQAMAAENGFSPMQASDLYPAEGATDDWAYGEHGIISYTFELYPTGSPGFYPRDDVIERETARNEEAFLTLFEYADCPTRIIDVTCGGGGDDPGDPDPEVCEGHEEVLGGSLAGRGRYDVHPDGSTFEAAAGDHRGCLDAPEGADFTLYLYRCYGWWGCLVVESASTADTDAAEISYSGDPGSYAWMVRSWGGAGDYTLGFERP